MYGLILTMLHVCYMYTAMHTYVFAWLHMHCMCVCISRKSLKMYVHIVCTCVYVDTCIHTYVRTYIQCQTDGSQLAFIYRRGENHQVSQGSRVDILGFTGFGLECRLAGFVETECASLLQPILSSARNMFVPDKPPSKTSEKRREDSTQLHSKPSNSNPEH